MAVNTAESRINLIIQGEAKINAALNQAAREIQGLQRQIKSLERNNERLENSNRRASEANRRLENSFFSLSNAVKAYATFNISRFLTDLVGDTVRAISAQERYTIAFGQTLGSLERGRALYAELTQAAIRLPGSAEDLAEAYRSLSLRGLNPSVESLERLIDLSTGLGKPVSQLVEAIADASVNQFDRLAELGIIARQTNDTVIFTFQGVRTEVDKTAQAINEYFESLSGQFSGRAEAQNATLATSFENLTDSIVAALNRLNESTGFTEVLSGVIDEAALDIRLITGLADETDKLGRARIRLFELENRLRNLETEGFRLDSLRRESIERRIVLTRAEIKGLEVGILLRDSFNKSLDESAKTEADNTANLIRQGNNLVQAIERRNASLSNQRDGIVRNAREISQALAEVEPELAQALIDSAKDLEQTTQRIAATRQLEQETRKLQTELDNIQNNTGSRIEQIINRYQRNVDVINSVQNGAIAGVTLSATRGAELLNSELVKLRELVSTAFGPKLVADGTQETRQAIEQRNELIREAFAGSRIDIQQFLISQVVDIEVYDKNVREALARNADRSDPFQDSYDQLLANRQEFIANLRRSSFEEDDTLREFNDNEGRAFISSLDLTTDATLSTADQLGALIERYRELSGQAKLSSRSIVASTNNFANVNSLLQQVGQTSAGSNVTNFAELQNQLNLINTFEDQQIITAANAEQRRREIRNRELSEIESFQSRKLSLEQFASLRSIELERTTVSQRLSIAGSLVGAFAQIAQDLEQNENDNFIRIRNLRAAEASFNALAAANQILAQGGIFAIPVAAVVAATGLARAVSILNTDPGEIASDPGSATSGSGNSNSNAIPQANQSNTSSGNTIIFYSGVGQTEAEARRIIGRGLQELSQNGEIQIDDRDADIRVVNGTF